MGRLFTLPVLLLVGCAPAKPLIVGPSSPQPHVPQSGVTVIGSLQLSDSLRDSFALPAVDGAPPARVHGWRKTLRRGFESAFGPDEASGGTLLIAQAALRFVRKSRMVGKTAYASLDDEQILLAHGGGHAPTPRGPPRLLYAHLEFSARYTDPSGSTRTVSGIVFSSDSIGTKTSATAVVRTAVEMMFEQIAVDLTRSAEKVRSAQQYEGKKELP